MLSHSYSCPFFIFISLTDIFCLSFSSFFTDLFLSFKHHFLWPISIKKFLFFTWIVHLQKVVELVGWNVFTIKITKNLFYCTNFGMIMTLFKIIDWIFLPSVFSFFFCLENLSTSFVFYFLFFNPLYLLLSFIFLSLLPFYYQSSFFSLCCLSVAFLSLLSFILSVLHLANLLTSVFHHPFHHYFHPFS